MSHLSQRYRGKRKKRMKGIAERLIKILDEAAYQGRDTPCSDEITPVVEVLKTHKAEILRDPCFLIEETIQEINKAWKPGTLSGLKPLPGAWQRMLSLEDEINRKALAGDTNSLKKVLVEYKELFSGIDSGERQGILGTGWAQAK
jgi:hypothetical protein